MTQMAENQKPINSWKKKKINVYNINQVQICLLIQKSINNHTCMHLQLHIPVVNQQYLYHTFKFHEIIINIMLCYMK